MTSESGSRKFKDDRTVNLINSTFISLKDTDMKRNNEILHAIINEVITTIKGKNEFFKAHYRKIMFVGSYYKGTKVGRPEEFDLDLVIELPLNTESITFEGNVPGYTKIKLSPDSYKPGWELHGKKLAKWVTPEGYLNQEEFRQSIESSFQNMPKVVNVGDEKYELRVRKCGPAFTLLVKGSASDEMSVDLVPVLEFKTQPPVPGDFSSSTWFAVPKTNRHLTEPHLYWRMSFYSFEKAMLKKNGYLKPVVRQLKKLRDTADWKIIASYHIETLALHRIKAMEEKPELQKNSTTEHFVEMLCQLKEACETNKIINFWDKSHNLIEELKPVQLIGIKGRLDKIIKQIEKDPFSIADHVLTKQERTSIEPELNLYRDSDKSAKIAAQQPAKTNENKSKPSNSCNSTPSNASDSNSTLMNIYRAFAGTNVTFPTPQVIPRDATKVSKDPKPMQTPSAKQKPTNPIATKTDDSTSNVSGKIDGFAEIMNMLKSIQSEMADTKDAINLLTRRVGVVEEKLDNLLSRSTAKFAEPVAMMNPRYSREMDLQSLIGLPN